MGERMLLVEGRADSFFYMAYCRRLSTEVIVRPPVDVGAKVDSKSNAIHLLPNVVSQLRDGAVEKLGIVVDADYEAEHGLGFARTLAKVEEVLVEYGFTRHRGTTGGFLFKHPDRGLNPVGLWIMPDNQHEGMLEDFVKRSIGGPQSVLRDHAVHSVVSLPVTLFKAIHRAKAEVATWLAYQQMPGQGVEAAVSKTLIDLASPDCRAFEGWLREVFG